MDITKYDRQIRLFGMQTQESISTASVQVVGSANLVAAEIIKNLTLLGIKKLYVNQQMIDCTKMLVPNRLEEINETMVIEVCEDFRDAEYMFFVDLGIDEAQKGKKYFICSKCFTISTSPTEHVCSPSTTLACKEACECLIGALAVQNFIKSLQGLPIIEEYKLEL